MNRPNTPSSCIRSRAGWTAPDSDRMARNATPASGDREMLAVRGSKCFSQHGGGESRGVCVRVARAGRDRRGGGGGRGAGGEGGRRYVERLGGVDREARRALGLREPLPVIAN